MRTNAIIFLALLVATGPAMASNVDEIYRQWQLDRLHTPTAGQLAHEHAGRVSIYDGLTDREVEQVMETQFDRLANMMFVRTIVTDVDGSALRDERAGALVTEDDDCD